MKASDRYLVKDVSCLLDGHALRVGNLSVGGLFVATDRPPMKGQVLSLEIALKGRPPFRIVGRVSWINRPEKPEAPALPQGFGIKITQIAMADKLALVDLLKRSAPHAVRRSPTP